MRRAFQTLLLALSSLVLVALPAAAEEAEVSTEAFGSGQWDGLLLGLIFGAIVGIALFVDAYSGSSDEPSHH